LSPGTDSKFTAPTVIEAGPRSSSSGRIGRDYRRSSSATVLSGRAPGPGRTGVTVDSFAGRVAVVTGAGSGIGAALARGFAAEGASVVVADIDEAAARTVADDIASRATAVAVDVTDPSSVDRLAEQVYAEHGRVDVLVNNAGVFQGGLMWQRSPEDWRWTFDVNVFGIVNGVRSFVPRMLEAGSDGHIVNTASVAAFVAGAASGPYVTSKAAALSVSECLALDLAAVGSSIGVSVLTPSAFDTGIARTAAVRPEVYGSDDSEDARMVADGLAAMTAQGLAPDEVVAPVIAGIRERRFLIPTRPSYEAQIRNRFEALLRRELPGPVLVD
jgi:NAD(P)-dependent dehydrogenase (short-subunit alcohol dehydrogenase family)